MRKEPTFKTEADLCAAFIEWAGPQGWTAYPETAGWDILLVAIDGTQIGVQAKLKFNLAVLSQAIGEAWNACHEAGPDFRAVLVPDGAREEICAALGLMAIRHVPNSWRKDDIFSPRLDERFGGWRSWHYWNPSRRIELPKYVPDVVAGSAAPVRLTRWKIAALSIMATLELRGYVTRADFKRFGIDPRRWIADPSWLKPGEQPGQFVRGDALRFADQHPEVYPQVLADVRESLGAGLLQESAV